MDRSGLGDGRLALLAGMVVVSQSACFVYQPVSTLSDQGRVHLAFNPPAVITETDTLGAAAVTYQNIVSMDGVVMSLSSDSVVLRPRVYQVNGSSSVLRPPPRRRVAIGRNAAVSFRTYSESRAQTAGLVLAIPFITALALLAGFAIVMSGIE